METGKGSSLAASKKHRQCSRFLGRRLVHSKHPFRERFTRIF
jgi:hypothetical protein